MKIHNDNEKGRHKNRGGEFRFSMQTYVKTWACVHSCMYALNSHTPSL